MTRKSKSPGQIERCNLYFSLGNLKIRGLSSIAWGTNPMDNNVFKKDMCFKPQLIQKHTSGTEHTSS